MLVVLLTAALLSLFSMYVIRGSVLKQATDDSRSDFSSQIVRVQKHLNASNLTGTDQYQQLVSNLASELQSNGSSNLVGVYLMERDAADSAERGFVPVSTEPEYSNLVSSSMRNRMRADTSGLIYYQPVRIPRTSGGTPGAVLGSVISSNNMGSLEVFALYSYQSQQQALSQIQINMLMVCVALSVLIGMIIFLVMRSVITPVRRVALATEIMASGTFDARVAVDRADEIGVLQKSFNEMAESLENQIEELEKAGDMQRSFVSDVSHELRTPVTTMRMAADMLSMHKDEYDATTKRTVELLDGQIRRFQEMLAICWRFRVSTPGMRRLIWWSPIYASPSNSRLKRFPPSPRPNMCHWMCICPTWKCL